MDKNRLNRTNNLHNHLEKEQKLNKAEEEVRKSEARLAEAECMAGFGNYILDLERDEFLWSVGACRIFGMRPGKARPDFQKFLKFIHPEDKKSVTAIFNRAIKNKSRYRVEYRVVLKSGITRILIDSGEVVCNGQGSPVQMYGVLQDVTERRRLEKSLVEIEEHERQRIGRDLHDGIGQLLTGIGFKARGLGATLKKSSHSAFEEAMNISKLVEAAKHQVSDLLKGVSPVEMDGEGLMAGLENLSTYITDTFGIPCVFICHKPVSINNRTAITQLYRIAQEGVTNAVKHAKAAKIVITLCKRYSKVTMTIKDDGVGIPETFGRSEGMGLKIMNHRASIINARLEIKGIKNMGTIITCVLSDKAVRKDEHA